MRYRRRAPGAPPAGTVDRGHCPTGKTCYSHDEAQAKAKRHRRVTGDRVQEYHCRGGCGWWHWGTPDGRKRRRW